MPFNRRFTRSVTTRVNVDAPRTPEDTYFCPGALGGVQWNGPAYAPDTNMAYVGAVDWCATVTVQSGSQARSVSLGQPCSGNAPQGETGHLRRPGLRGDGPRLAQRHPRRHG